MKLITKIVAGLVLFVFAGYHISYFVLPSVTVVNTSAMKIESAKVKLPNSGLDFGDLEAGSENTLHYALTQTDGDYQYQISFGESVLEGRCGMVRNKEINKRVTLTVSQDAVVCH